MKASPPNPRDQIHQHNPKTHLIIHVTSSTSSTTIKTNPTTSQAVDDHARTIVITDIQMPPTIVTGTLAHRLSLEVLETTNGVREASHSFKVTIKDRQPALHGVGMPKLARMQVMMERAREYSAVSR
jgi:hypothetical protein